MSITFVSLIFYGMIFTVCVEGYYIGKACNFFHRMLDTSDEWEYQVV